MNKYEIFGKVCKLNVGDKTVLIDTKNLNKLCQFHWVIMKTKRYAYARRHKGKKVVYMHKDIIQTKPGEIVDHINGDTLDNRMDNLKRCSRSENRQNISINHTRKRLLPCGVCKSGNKFVASIKFREQRFYLGTFEDKILAGLAYDEAADKFYGPFGYRNFGYLISIKTAKTWIKKNKGLFFYAIFIKRSNNRVRSMSCRTGVYSGCKGKGLLFSPQKLSLLPVYDLSIKSHRFVNLK